MSWDKELWVDVSLIQSAPHRAGQHTASVLIVRYAFPSMHRRTTVSAAASSPPSRTRELVHTKFLCAPRKQVHILPPSDYRTYMHAIPVLVADRHAEREICLRLSSQTTPSSKFSSLTDSLCHRALIWADLCCAVCRSCRSWQWF